MLFCTKCLNPVFNINSARHHVVHKVVVIAIVVHTSVTVQVPSCKILTTRLKNQQLQQRQQHPSHSTHNRSV